MNEEKKPLYGVMIPRIELLELTSGITKEISTHSLGQWLKATTKGEYAVIHVEGIKRIEDWLSDIEIGASEMAYSMADLKENWL